MTASAVALPIADSPFPAPFALRAALAFIRSQAAKPVLESAAFTGGAPRELFATENHTVPIHDLRPLAASLSLDREGFVLRPAPTAVADLYDHVAVAPASYADIEPLVQRALGANRVVIFHAHHHLYTPPPRSEE